MAKNFWRLKIGILINYMIYFSNMKILKFLFKTFVVCVLIAAIAIAGVVFYLKFFGKANIEQMLSKMLGSRIKFQNVSFDLNKGLVDFKGFTVLNKIGFEENIFKADKFTVSIDKERFKKDKTLVLQEVVVENGVLTIERNRRGVFNIALADKEAGPDFGGIAYAAEAPSAGSLYNLAKNFKSVVIKNSIINFKDSYISQTPFTCYCDKLNFQFRTGPASGGNIGATCDMASRIPMANTNNGSVSFQANMAIYPERVDMEGSLETHYINLMLFHQYLDRYTPFYFTSGSFGSTTTFRMHNNVIDSLTTMLFKNLGFRTQPGMENAQFLQTSVNRLAPYLQSQQGGLYFDFVIKGPLRKPQAELGPRVKFAIGMVALEEFGKAMQQLQQFKQ